MKDEPMTSAYRDVPGRNRGKLSHEIRSTAQGLLGYLLIFSDDVRPQLDAEQARVLDRINYFAKKMSEMLLDLLAESSTASHPAEKEN